MVSEIINLRNFRSRISDYINKAMSGENVIIKSKDREVVLISLNDYRKLTGDETDYLFSTDANKRHLLEGMEEIEKGETVKVKIDELFD